jgi:hypoxanthine phosphoribosyltransferase
MIERFELLFNRDQIAAAVKKLAQQISRDYGNEEVVVISILKGAFMFTADLVRELTCPIAVDFMRATSYGSGTKTSGNVTLTKDLEIDIADKNVIIVEDIIDSGLTLVSIRDLLLSRKPKSLKICALVDKRARREVTIEGDYVGFTIEDGFIIGYGIDYAELYRNVPEIYVDPEA